MSHYSYYSQHFCGIQLLDAFIVATNMPTVMQSWPLGYGRLGLCISGSGMVYLSPAVCNLSKGRA